MKQKSFRNVILILIGLGILTLLVSGISYISLSYIGGTRLGIRSSLAAVTNMLKATNNRQEALADSQGNYTNIIFLHHSVGQHLIEQGNMRQLFTNAGYQFWDQGYNQDEGQRNPEGLRLEYVYYVPHDNTDPVGLEKVFSQPTFTLPLNTFSGLLQHEVIIFKSCFPNSQINSDKELEQYKDWYINMHTSFKKHPDKLFIAVTQPPLNPAVTNPEAALRARALANWLTSEEFLGKDSNLAAFDLFDRLAEGDPNSPELNMLHVDYREGNDSHPNEIANKTIAPQLVDAIIQAIEKYKNIQQQH